MMVNQNTTRLRSMRLNTTPGGIGYALSARLSALYDFCPDTRFVPFAGMTQGDIVPILREAPPPLRR